MLVEALVLDRDDRLLHLRRDLVSRGRSPAPPSRGARRGSCARRPRRCSRSTCWWCAEGSRAGICDAIAETSPSPSAVVPSTPRTTISRSRRSLRIRRRRRFTGASVVRLRRSKTRSVAPRRLESLAHVARRPDPQRRRRPARGRSRAQARARPAAAREARDRRHLARHPRRPRDPAAADARLPGRGSHRRADRRRLHDPDRRPVRPLRRAPDPLRRGDRRERAHVHRPGAGDPRSRPHRGSLQRRVAVEAHLRRGRRARAHDDGRAAARAGRLRQALPRRPARSRSPSSSTR